MYGSSFTTYQFSVLRILQQTKFYVIFWLTTDVLYLFHQWTCQNFKVFYLFQEEFSIYTLYVLSKYASTKTVLLYACETWSTTKLQCSRIDAFDM